MRNNYMIKFAWKCNHKAYGEILSFVITPLIKTTPNSYGYSLTYDLDEIVRYPSNHPEALSLLKRLVKVSSDQWYAISDDYIEEFFDFEDFDDEYYYQDDDEYKRDVLFHTHKECI